MAHNRYTFTESKYSRFLKEGRGRGVGKDYKPWLTVFDVRSRGRVHRVFCAMTGRVHHLLSDNEYRAFLVLWWRDDTIDIREQFPILDRRETLAIARLLGVRHPVDRSSQTPIVVTTDLLSTHDTIHGQTLAAHAVKETDDLSNARTLEKLEIERTYWMQRGVPWSLMLSADLRNNFTRNLAWIYDPGPHTRGDVMARRADELLAPFLFEAIGSNRNDPVRCICLKMDARLGLTPGRTLACLRRLIAAKRIRAPLDVARIQDLPASLFRF
ncbi:TnsA endonuclease N-terminal domain-containing protein [Microvirga soli]|uniref:TnsA endonuclease N-terminal domain-containing protein n=1 Tax=Microvirga soli TaxID=1854496 RepID=UPI00191CF0D3|nr:TnsA endonuclease N-terminal domain-containing protein [Microvirga soli]